MRNKQELLALLGVPPAMHGRSSSQGKPPVPIKKGHQDLGAAQPPHGGNGASAPCWEAAAGSWM